MGKRTKLWLIVGCMFLLLSIVTGCNTDEPVPDDVEQEVIDGDVKQEGEENEVEGEEETEPITAEEVGSILQSSVGSDDTVVSLDVVDYEVRAVVELAPHDLLPAKEIAISRYSEITDELLRLKGWEVVTVEFVDVGTVSMDRDKRITNEFNMSYFPITEIDRQLNK